MASHSEVKDSYNNIHSVNCTITLAQRRTWLHTHSNKQTHSCSMTICVRETSVCLFEAVQSPIYFSLSAFYCSDRHSPAEPPSAPLVCPLSSPFLTNLSLIYLFLSSARRSLPAANCCWAPLTCQREGADNKEKATCSTATETGKTYFHYKRFEGSDPHSELVLHIFAASCSGM